MKPVHQMSDEVTAILDQFVRDMTRLSVGIFGLAYVAHPETIMTIIRNTPGDPVHQAQMVLDIVKNASQDRQIEMIEIKPLN